MPKSFRITLLLALGAAVAIAGCDGLDALLASRSGELNALDDLGTNGNLDTSDFDDGDEAGALPPGQPVPPSAVVGARIRNLTDLSADVTLRFYLTDVVVHLSFLRIRPNTSTVVAGPDRADRITASGVFEDGEPLPGAEFLYEVDFTEGTEAVYIIGSAPDDANIPPTISVLEPADDVETQPGGTITVRIADEDPDSSAVIDFHLDADDEPLNGGEVLLAAGLPEDPDEDGDTFELTVPESAAGGSYRLLAVISDERSTEVSVAPALIQVIAPSGDAPDDPGDPVEPPPVSVGLTLTQPALDLNVPVDGQFTARWAADLVNTDQATLALFLDPGDGQRDGDELLLVDDLSVTSESPEGAADLDVSGIPAGTYLVLGELAADGATDTDVAPGRLSVLTEGSPPVISITEPDSVVRVRVGQSVDVAWQDEDPDDNAAITFYLDSNGVDLDGGEVWIAAFTEDADGPGNDDADIRIVNVAPGSYDLLAVVFDGVFWNTARAAGRIVVTDDDDDVTFDDCQPNGVPDDQELVDNDCNTNGIPDDCEADCNTNGTPDDCDIAGDVSQDCNTNAIPDECDITAGTASDCNTSGIPDQCDLAYGEAADCNSNGVPDECDLADQSSPDCNSNAVPDECDIASGYSQDADTNGIPDECQPLLSGYWRFDFFAEAQCEYSEDFALEKRYFYFAPSGEVTENWIQAPGYCIEEQQAYLRLSYPGTQGPSYIPYLTSCNLTADTDRTITLEIATTPEVIVAVTESVSLPRGTEEGESGVTSIIGKPAAPRRPGESEIILQLDGTWEFQAPDHTVCGRFTAQPVDAPPELPVIIDLEPTNLILAAADLITPSTIQDVARAFQVRYSFADAPVTVEYYLSSDAFFDQGDDLLLGTEELHQPGLTIGAHAGSAPTLTVPADLETTCNAYLLVVVDPGNVVAEVDEENNVLAVEVTVSPDGDPPCDLQR